MLFECKNPNCGETFYSPWHRIQAGCGCPYCSIPAKKVGKRNNFAFEFPELAKEWDFSKNKISPVDILSGSNQYFWWICSNCKKGWFTKLNSRTNMRSGCPACSQSRGEKRIDSFLTNNNFIFKREKSLLGCKSIRNLLFDFVIYFKKYVFVCEFHGEQHYASIEYFGGEQTFKTRKERDKIKQKYCEENNIPLIIIPYWDYDKIEEILTHELNL
jgi:hypothetical protein